MLHHLPERFFPYCVCNNGTTQVGSLPLSLCNNTFTYCPHLDKKACNGCRRSIKCQKNATARNLACKMDFSVRQKLNFTHGSGCSNILPGPKGTRLWSQGISFPPSHTGGVSVLWPSDHTFFMTRELPHPTHRTKRSLPPFRQNMDGLTHDTGVAN